MSTGNDGGTNHQDHADAAPAGPGVVWVDRLAGRDDLMTVVSAEPAAVRVARRLTRGWLDSMDWPVVDAEDIELAVNEAIANVVDHAYPPEQPGPATLHAWVTTDPRTYRRRVVVAVTDTGRWAAYHPDSPAPEARGHGLLVMSGCMAELHIQRAVAGTTVIMVSATVPA